MGEQLVAGLVTGMVIVGIVAVIYQLNKNKGVGVASDVTKVSGNVVTNLFK